MQYSFKFLLGLHNSNLYFHIENLMLFIFIYFIYFMPKISPLKLMQISMTHEEKKSGKVLYHSCLMKKNIPMHKQNNRDPVIILHGLLGSSRNFQTWAKLLYDKLDGEHDIICMDLRNHGRSSLHGGLKMDYKMMANDILTTIKRLGIERAHIIGHSMGGKVVSLIILCFPIYYSFRLQQLH